MQKDKKEAAATLIEQRNKEPRAVAEDPLACDVPAVE